MEAFDRAGKGPGADGERDGLRVLVAEDNDVQFRAMSRHLQFMGHEVDRASDGDEVIDRLREGEHDVVIMDLRMQRVTGWDAIKAIRDDREFYRLPVIAVSAFAMPGDLHQALAIGADAAFSKPLDMSEVEQKMFELAKRSVDRGPGERAGD